MKLYISVSFMLGAALIRHMMLLVMLVIGTASAAHAGMEKIATMGDKGICFHWWPVLPKIDGWYHDRGTSLSNDINAQVPVGNTFADAEAVIYAKAPYKPRIPDIKSLSDFIANDKKELLIRAPDTEIIEVESLSTKDGQVLRSFFFKPSLNGPWERVSYGDEGDFFLVFVVSAKTNLGLERVMGDYTRFINLYEKTSSSQEYEAVR